MIKHNEITYDNTESKQWQEKIDQKMKLSLAAAYFTLYAYPQMGAHLEKMEYGKELSVF